MKVGNESSVLKAVQALLGLRFSQPQLLLQALTHRSRKGQAHYERLEFLGDAVLQLLITEHLFYQYPEDDEGCLSRKRAQLVREETLCKIAQHLQLAQYLRLGEGEVRAGVALRPSVLADVVEALIGAIYIDLGMAAAQQWVLTCLQALELQAPALSRDAASDLSVHSATGAKDAKSQLQEYLQALRLDLPQYQVLRIQGAEHAQEFCVVCTVEFGQQQLKGEGVGRTRKRAEQAAAAKVLQACLAQ